MISNCTLSKQKQCGVPHGSILGSLLLIIFLLILAQIIKDSYITIVMLMTQIYIHKYPAEVTGGVTGERIKRDTSGDRRN